MPRKKKDAPAAPPTDDADAGTGGGNAFKAAAAAIAGEIEESEGLKKAETLKGDIRDRILALVRAMTTPWSELHEAAQQAIADASECIAEMMIFRCLDIAAAEGAPSMRMKVAGVKFGKDALSASLVGMLGDPCRHILADMNNREALVVFDDPSRFMGEAAPPAIDPDAPEMPFESAGEGAPAAAEDDPDAAPADDDEVAP